MAETIELWTKTRDYYAAHNCALIAVAWNTPPDVSVFLKPGSPQPPLPDFLPADTKVAFHEPKRVMPQ